MARFTLIVACCLAVFAGTVVANAAETDLTLTSHDGALRLDGQFLSFDGEFLRIETEHGPVTVESAGFNCDGSGCPDLKAIEISASVVGSDDLVTRLFPALLEGFALREGLLVQRRFVSDTDISLQLIDPKTGNSVARFGVQATTHRKSQAMLAARQADFAFLQAPTDQNVRQDIVALDGVVPVVSPENPLATISFDTLSRLLSGKTRDWSDQGRASSAVTLHLPSNNVAISLLSERTNSKVANATRHDDPDALADAVAADDGAIGVTTLSRIGNAVPVVLVGGCGIAAPATPSSLKTEDYPLTLPLYIARSNGRHPGLVRSFMKFTLSDVAQPWVRAAGYTDQSIGLIPFNRQGDRIARAIPVAGSIWWFRRVAPSDEPTE